MTTDNADRLAERLRQERYENSNLRNEFCVVRRDLLDEAAASLAKQQATPAQPRLIGWRTADYLMETADQQKAANWQPHFTVLPIFEGDIHTKLAAPQSPPSQVPAAQEEK